MDFLMDFLFLYLVGKTGRRYFLNIHTPQYPIPEKSMGLYVYAIHFLVPKICANLIKRFFGYPYNKFSPQYKESIV